MLDIFQAWRMYRQGHGLIDWLDCPLSRQGEEKMKKAEYILQYIDSDEVTELLIDRSEWTEKPAEEFQGSKIEAVLLGDGSIGITIKKPREQEIKNKLG